MAKIATIITKIWITDSGQKYSYVSDFPNGFDIKLWFSNNYPEVNSRLIFIIVLSTKAEKVHLYVVYIYNFQTIFRSMYFKSSWFEHRLNNLSRKVLSLYCISDEIISVLCLTCVFSKCLAYKTMLKWCSITTLNTACVN
jgi:hypothetical protein